MKNRRFIKLFLSLFVFFIFNSISTAQVSNGILLDTVKAGKFDLGKMWTFEHAPVDYFSEAYGFKPSQQWLDNVRMSALRFATYCSASFVSADGLVMTNHHCGRESVTEVQKEGEDLHATGFWAEKIEDERPVKSLFVEQMVNIQDVTKEIQDAIELGKTDAEKVTNKKKKISEIEKSNAEKSGLRCQIVTLFNGGQYSLYYYKRYNDVRLVFAPEDDLGFFGGDPDNFTYPRYNLDCTFFRVYDESGKPLKTEHFYKWSKNGAMMGEPIFVVGNPGSTNRLNTIAQLEFDRDYNYPVILGYLDMLVNFYTDMIVKYPERKSELTNELFSYANSQKVYKGIIQGLNDPYLMAKKKDFEKTLRASIDSKPNLKSKYGKSWDEIASGMSDVRKIFPELVSYSLNPRWCSVYFDVAKKFVDATQSNTLIADTVIAKMYDEMDKDLEYAKLSFELDLISNNLGADNSLTKDLTNGKKGSAAVDYALSKSELSTKEKAIAFMKKGSNAVLNSSDPFVNYVIKTTGKYEELVKQRNEINARVEVNKQLLGRAVFEVYGNSIPPDATFTLRISDGVLQSYNYNGTVAPLKTTFYGMYERYYSYDKQYPWTMPEKWQNPPKEFRLETPFNFISTNDIIGGNSGSPMINKDAEIVGLAFDGNIESLPGQFIFTTEANRTVSVASQGMLEAINNLYKATRLGKELENGGIQ